MNPIKAIVFSLLLASNLIYSVGAFSETAPAITNGDEATDTTVPKADKPADTALPGQTKTTGTIILRDHENSICTLFLPGPGTSQHRYYLADTYPIDCRGWNDRTRSIAFAEVPSATTILLSDAGDCSQTHNSNSWIALKTTKKQTHSTIIEVEYLMTYQEKQIIEPGLQMITFRRNAATPSLRDRISCIEVTTSAQPPAPSATTP